MSNISNPGNTPEPAGRPAQMPCPPWCTTNHPAQDRWQAQHVERVVTRTGVVPDWMARWHTRTVAQIPNPAAGPTMAVLVSLYRDDSLVDPEPDRVVICAEKADCMSPDTAMKVASAIARAAMIATGAVAGEPR